MYSTRLFDFLATYIPVQVAYAISAIFFFIEKVLLPKLNEVISSASLDPNSLLPFVISAIAIYISVVSIYHAFRASIRLIWWTIKWSLVIVTVWFALGLANEIMKSSNINSSTSQSNYFNGDGRDTINHWLEVLKNSNPFSARDNHKNQPQGFISSLFDPFKFVFGNGLLSSYFYDYGLSFFSIKDFDSTYSKHQKAKESSSYSTKPNSRNEKYKSQSDDKSSEKKKFKDDEGYDHRNEKRKSSRGSNDYGDGQPQIILNEETKKIWSENFQKPFQNFVNQIQNKQKQRNQQKNR